MANELMFIYIFIYLLQHICLHGLVICININVKNVDILDIPQININIYIHVDTLLVFYF